MPTAQSNTYRKTQNLLRYHGGAPPSVFCGWVFLLNSIVSYCLPGMYSNRSHQLRLSTRFYRLLRQNQPKLTRNSSFPHRRFLARMLRFVLLNQFIVRNPIEYGRRDGLGEPRS